MAAKFIKRRRVTGLVVVVGIVLAAQAPAYEPAPQVAAATPAPALKGLDPVLLIEGKSVPGKEELTVVRDGLRYVFSSAASKARFEKEPSQYEVQFRGQCAAMPVARGRPDLFAVVDGRIYLFASEHCRTAFLDDPKSALKPRKNVAILLYDGVELLDFAGPGEVFTAAAGGTAFRVLTVAASREAVLSQGFAKITPEYTFDDCPKPDVVVIPGGSLGVSPVDPRAVAWVKRAATDADVTLSVCTGAFLLATANLLEGKEATTHHHAVELLRKQFPKVTVRSDRRFIDNGKVITAAGVSAGTDAALHVVERLLGPDGALETAEYMEYPWKAGKSGKSE